MSKAEATEESRFLNNQQEQQLVSYIREISERCLPPTPAMVAEMATQLGGRPPGNNWSSRFVERHKAELDSNYLNNLDLERHQADSVASFEQYFAIIQRKIDEYQIQPSNTYNMDEKGFLIGKLTKVKRIFPKDLKASQKLLGAGQDGCREWITVVGTICADGTTLPPLLIYDSNSSSLQSSWLQDFKPDEYDTWFTASPNGWTSDELGFKWLETLFEKHTQSKARRDWRLLFVDGHGSYVTLKFLEWAQQHKILIAVYPPHSTHRLQPLDVGCFSPLTTFYSQELDQHTRLSEGQIRMTKRDFFKCFNPAWQKAFTNKNVASSWSKAGLFPFDPSVVLNQIKVRNQREQASRSHSSSPSACWESPSGMRKLRAIINNTVDRRTKKTFKKLTEDLQKSKAEVLIQRAAKQNAIQALRDEKKKKRRKKKLIEQFRADEGTGALLFSPSKVKAALELQEQKYQDEQQKQEAKAQRIEERALTKARKEQEAQQKRDDRVMASAARKAAEALRKAQRETERSTKRAQKQAERDLKAQNKTPRGRPHKKQVLTGPVVVKRPMNKPKAPKQLVSRSGRVLRTPARLAE